MLVRKKVEKMIEGCYFFAEQGYIPMDVANAMANSLKELLDNCSDEELEERLNKTKEGINVDF
jgi:hypothetical protein